jgi:hypothetical protein
MGGWVDDGWVDGGMDGWVGLYSIIFQYDDQLSWWHLICE